MKISFYEIKDWEKDYLKERLAGHELAFFVEPLNEKNLQGLDADIISPFVGCELTAPVLAKFNHLKFIATRSTGFDHVELDFCNHHGIIVSNVPTYGDNTVAEFTFALLLALMRKIYRAIKRVKEEGEFVCDDLMGFDLKGKTLGVVGTGHIGVHVVKIAKGFDMHVLAYDPHPNDQLVREFQIRYVSLEELLKSSDIVTLHVPYMPATHHLINPQNIKLMKKGGILLNTARGGLVDTQALLQALQEGFLAGAAMDVLEEEGFVKDEIRLLYKDHPSREELKTVLADHELIHLDNVIVTPHTAFNTKEAVERILDTTVNNILAFIHGQPINTVKI